MSRKPENVFISSIHRKLTGRVFAETMHNSYRGGIPDVWYSGGKGDIWIEYKWIPKIPPRAGTIEITTTALQKRWLEHRHEEGRRVAVVIGCPEGGVWLDHPELAEDFLTTTKFKTLLQTRAEIAEKIFAITGASPCLSRRPSPTRLE